MNQDTQTQKATARPWSLDELVIYHDNGPFRENVCITGYGQHKKSSIAKANAALIVRAVNEHATLCAVVARFRAARLWPADLEE